MKTPKLRTKDLRHITSGTLCHYDENALGFWQGTKDHDVRQNLQAFLAALPQGEKLDILELGCGPGRDVRYFEKLGHKVIGLDGSAEFCKMARRFTGCPIWQQDFLRLDLPFEGFHGIFANASLFHVPMQEMPRVLGELHAALKPKGILFSSNPRGNQEGWMGERYSNYMEFDIYQDLLEHAGFRVLQHYYRPEGRPCQDQPWLAVVSQKMA